MAAGARHLAVNLARHSPVPLRLEPIQANEDSTTPMSFAISVGVRRNEPELLARINRALDADAPQIRQLLHRYGVPLASADPPHSAP